MANLGSQPIRNARDLKRFEAEMTLEARLPEQSILDVFSKSAAQNPRRHCDHHAHDGSGGRTTKAG